LRISKAALRTLIATAIAAVSAPLAMGVFSAQAKTHPTHPRHGSKLLISASLAPEAAPPSAPTPDPTFHGVGPGLAPWVLKAGHVTIRGHVLDLRVRGLLIPGKGTGPVKTISAALYCGADSVTMPTATTGQVALSSTGNAFIHDSHFQTPASCLAPQVLVYPNGELISGVPSMYVAVDGQS